MDPYVDVAKQVPYFGLLVYLTWFLLKSSKEKDEKFLKASREKDDKFLNTLLGLQKEQHEFQAAATAALGEIKSVLQQLLGKINEWK